MSARVALHLARGKAPRHCSHEGWLETRLVYRAHWVHTARGWASSLRLRRRPRRYNQLAQALRLLTLLWLAWPPLAAKAQQQVVYLEWQRPLGSTCPPASVLERDVEDTLDRKVFTATPAAQLRIQGSIEERDSETWVHLTARSRSGRVLGMRELHAVGGGCAALRSDIVLVLTLLVEREEVVSEAPEVSSSFGISSTLMANVLPRWDVGVGPTLLLDIASVLQLRVDLSYFFPVAIRTPSGVAADLHAVSFTLRACPRLYGQDSALSLHVCAGAQAGAWLVAQTEPASRALQIRLLAQGLLELRAGLRLGESTSLTLGAGPSLSMSRAALYAAYASGTRMFLYRVPLLGAQVQLSLMF
jgi:hypothetical protein